MQLFCLDLSVIASVALRVSFGDARGYGGRATELYQSILALTNERKFCIVINNNFDKMQHARAHFWIMAAWGLYSCLPLDRIPLMSLMVVVIAAMNCNCNLFFIDLFWGQGEVSAPLRLPRTLLSQVPTG